MLWKKINRFWKTGLTAKHMDKVAISKKSILLIVMFICGILLCVCNNSKKSIKAGTIYPGKNKANIQKESTKSKDIETKMDIQTEKGYNLPVDARQRKKAENDCKKMMSLIRGIYIKADKGNDLNIVLSDKTISKMQNKLKKTKKPVINTGVYANMDNFKSVDKFLKKCIKGIRGQKVVYEINSEGGIKRMKFIFDGSDIYVLSVSASWNNKNKAGIDYVSYARIKKWKYTKKGWFCYEVCVPEYPEVMEVVDGSHMLRIKPVTDENREISKKCILGLGYQGNNLLCSNWDVNNMKNLDYNGLYEYLYEMKYNKKFKSGNNTGYIQKEKFENLIMEYLPITRKKLQKYAVYNKKNQVYLWKRLGCFNYSPSYFGTSIPEVTNIKKNKDGTITLTVDAICQMVLYNDAVITHKLIVRFSGNGHFKYLGNKILNNGVKKIPDYQYRINK